MNFELKRKKFGRGIPNDILIDIRGVAVLAVIKELPLVHISYAYYLSLNHTFANCVLMLNDLGEQSNFRKANKRTIGA